LAVITKEKNFSYAELNSLVESVKNELKHLGIRRGNRVAFTAKTKWQAIILLFALFRIEATACPLNFRYPNPQSLIELLDPHFVVDLEEISSLGSHFQQSDTPIDQNFIASLLFTSGTAGLPKIAAHSFANHYFSAIGSIHALNLNPGDRWLLSLPLFHVGGLGILFRCFLAGSAVVISEEPLALSLKTHKISHVSLVPLQLYRLLEERPDLLEEISRKLKAVLIGGAPLNIKHIEQAQTMSLKIFSTYGCTEMSSSITLDAFPTIFSSFTTSGTILPFREMMLDKDGEILVRGKTLFQGYWDKANGIHLSLNPSGWFETKDLGLWTTEGKLCIIGRKDNLFISGGENIQPEYIENALLELPGILEAVVVPIKDTQFGARPVAFINTEKNFEEDAIKLTLRKTLPGYMIPLRIFPLQQPSSNGSIKRSRHYFAQCAEAILNEKKFNT